MIGMRVKGLFFNDDKILRHMSQVTRMALGKSGGVIRKTAQRSMRYVTAVPEQKKRVQQGKQKKVKPRIVSKPGEPPRAVRPHPWLRKHLLYAYDPASRSVVVGPSVFGPSSGAPATLEFGGTVKAKGGKMARVEKRPYMAPALAAEVPHMADRYQDSLIKTV